MEIKKLNLKELMAVRGGTDPDGPAGGDCTKKMCKKKACTSNA